MTWSCQGEWTGAIDYRLGCDSLILSYRIRQSGGVLEDIKETVPLERTACHYGGKRPWFLCPRCWWRVAVLYGTGKRFLYQHCYRLPYTSQNENYMDRMMRKRARSESG